jgi:hypothetical protein
MSTEITSVYLLKVFLLGFHGSADGVSQDTAVTQTERLTV